MKTKKHAEKAVKLAGMATPPPWGHIDRVNPDMITGGRCGQGHYRYIADPYSTACEACEPEYEKDNAALIIHAGNHYGDIARDYLMLHAAVRRYLALCQAVEENFTSRRLGAVKQAKDHLRKVIGSD